MISKDRVVEYLKTAMPDAQITIVDKTGMMEHYKIHIVSVAFSDKNRLDRQRFVYHALREPMNDGRIHALELRIESPDEVGAASP